MKKIISVVLIMALVMGFVGCGAEKTSDKDVSGSKETQAENDGAEKEDAEEEGAEKEDTSSEEVESEGKALGDEQVVDAVKNYCLKSNPDLEDIVNEGEYDVSWTVESSDDNNVVVLYRSYTGAEVRYYVDRNSGEAYSTEFVPGITPEEEKTDETFNAWEYLGE